MKGCLKVVAGAFLLLLILVVWGSILSGPDDDRPAPPAATTAPIAAASGPPSPATATATASNSAPTVEDLAADAQLDAEIAALGMTEPKRRRIWRLMLAAEDRATWEGNRLFPFDAPVDRFRERMAYIEAREDELALVIRRKEHVDDDEMATIRHEAFRGDWEQPPYPSFDLDEARAYLRTKGWDGREPASYD